MGLPAIFANQKSLNNVPLRIADLVDRSPRTKTAIISTTIVLVFVWSETTGIVPTVYPANLSDSILQMCFFVRYQILKLQVNWQN